jgi:YebC/PmpR family DNA-binding regulatory protein
LRRKRKNDIIRYGLFLKVEKRIQIMSGHSKFANIKHKKEKNDAAKGKIFTMIGRELAVAVKEGGPDPANNFKLAQVVAKAKANNMPNDTIERGIKKAAGDGNSVNYETATYEGYGPSGTAIIVKCLTDNKNRTAANVRNAFTKGQGSIGTQGCVSYMFDEKGQIIINKEGAELQNAMNTWAVNEFGQWASVAYIETYQVPSISLTDLGVERILCLDELN